MIHLICVHVRDSVVLTVVSRSSARECPHAQQHRKNMQLEGDRRKKNDDCDDDDDDEDEEG